MKLRGLEIKKKKTLPKDVKVENNAMGIKVFAESAYSLDSVLVIQFQ